MNSLIEEAEDLTARVARGLGFKNITHETTAAQAAAATPTEEHMSFATVVADVEAHVKAAFDKIGEVDHAALAGIEAIEAHPETGTLLADVGALIGINLPVGILTSALAPVKALLQAYGPQIDQARQAAAEAAAQQQAA